jgi:hypothetical protein
VCPRHIGVRITSTNTILGVVVASYESGVVCTECVATKARADEAEREELIAEALDIFTENPDPVLRRLVAIDRYVFARPTDRRWFGVSLQGIDLFRAAMSGERPTGLLDLGAGHTGLPDDIFPPKDERQEYLKRFIEEVRRRELPPPDMCERRIVSNRFFGGAPRVRHGAKEPAWRIGAGEVGAFVVYPDGFIQRKEPWADPGSFNPSGYYISDLAIHHMACALR